MNKFASACKQTVFNAIWEGILNEMGRRRSVSENEIAEIVQMLAAKVQTVNIAKRLKRGHRTIKSMWKILIHQGRGGLMRVKER